jgi:alpha-mannosidase
MEKRLVKKAAQALDLAALEKEQWDQVQASIARMEKMLSPFSAKAREITVHLIGHSHIDMDWQWTWKDTVHCIRRDFKAVTDMM